MASSPPPDIYFGWRPEIDQFIQRIRWAYSYCPMVATSWWRSYPQNVGAGGAEYSQHLIATAADVYPTRGYSLDDLERALRASGLITVRYPRHVHAQLFRAGFLRRWALS